MWKKIKIEMKRVLCACIAYYIRKRCQICTVNLLNFGLLIKYIHMSGSTSYCLQSTQFMQVEQARMVSAMLLLCFSVLNR